MENESKKNIRLAYKIISWDVFEKEFIPAFEMQFEKFDEMAEIRLYESDIQGNVYFDQDIVISDTQNFNLVIQGNLIVKGNIDIDCEGIETFCYVGGDVRANSIILSGVASMDIRGNAEIEHGIMGMYGDDGGYLKIQGETNTKVILNCTDFNMSLIGAVTGVVIDSSYGELEADYTDGNLAEAIIDDLLEEGGGLSKQKVIEYLKQGRAVLKNESHCLKAYEAKPVSDKQAAKEEQISSSEALERFSFLAEADMAYSEDGKVVVYDGDAFINTDLDLDSYQAEADGIVINGNLYVTGSIINMEGDYGPFLVVAGNVTAKNIDKGGSDIYIYGDCKISNVIYGYYNHGELTVKGTVGAQYIINSDHFFEFAHVETTAICINDYSDCDEYDYYPEDFSRVFVAEVLDETLEAINSNIFIQRVNEGKRVMKSGAKPARKIVEEYIRELAESDTSISELNLSDKRLQQFPRSVLKMLGLKKLVLNNNSIGRLPEEIDKLEHLEELHLENCGLEELPETIGNLEKLRVLNVSSNNNCDDDNPNLQVGIRLPESIGKLKKLTSLDISYNNACQLPESLKELENLEVLSVYKCSDEHPVDFPEIICKLASLRALNIGNNSFTSIPDSFLQLTNLEELYMDTALCYMTSIAELYQLTKLRIVHADGLTGYMTRPRNPKVIKHFFQVTSLEELSLDRHHLGNELNDDAGHILSGIGKLVNLKVLDLSFNDLEDLPEELYSLKKLTSLNLQYNKLPKKVRERVATTFPEIKIDFRDQQVEEENNIDTDFLAMKKLIKQGNENRDRDRYKEALAAYDEAFSYYREGKVTDRYNLVYIHYTKMWIYANWKNSQSKEEQAEKHARCLEAARECLSLVPENWNVWNFTDEGQFHQEVIRYACNCIAWDLYVNSNESSMLETALEIAERGVAFADSVPYYYIIDTKVRILLKLNRKQEAYSIVERILSSHPEFSDFQDFKEDQDYMDWVNEVAIGC